MLHINRLSGSFLVYTDYKFVINMPVDFLLPRNASPGVRILAMVE